jgi:hypothetical protein
MKRSGIIENTYDVSKIIKFPLSRNPCVDEVLRFCCGLPPRERVQ